MFEQSLLERGKDDALLGEFRGERFRVDELVVGEQQSAGAGGSEVLVSDLLMIDWLSLFITIKGEAA